MGGWAQPTGAPHIAAKAIDPITVRDTLLPQRAIRSIIGVLFLKRGIYPSDTTVDQQSRRDNIGRTVLQIFGFFQMLRPRQQAIPLSHLCQKRCAAASNLGAKIPLSLRSCAMLISAWASSQA